MEYLYILRFYIRNLIIIIIGSFEGRMVKVNEVIKQPHDSRHKFKIKIQLRVTQGNILGINHYEKGCHNIL